MNLEIVSSAYYVPERVVTNDELSTLVDTTDEWIFSRTGIKTRHISDQENTSDLCVKVCNQLLESSELNPLEIDLIVVATISPDYLTPSTACIVQGRIGANNAFAFDISVACSGLVFALSIVQKYILSGMCKNAIVLSGDVLSKTIDWTDRSTCVLFGDGAGGILVRASEQKKMFYENLQSDGNKHLALTSGKMEVRNLFTPSHIPDPFQYLKMDGRAIFDFAVKKVPESIQSLLDEAETSIDEIKYIIPHQANKRIIDIFAKKLKINHDQFYLNIHRYSNTCGGTIGIALAEMFEKRLLHYNSGEKIILAGFGGGLTWGSILIEL